VQEQIYNEGSYVSGLSKTIIHNASLNGIPEGKHNITIYAMESGAYTWTEDASFILMEVFSINSSSTIFFTVDTVPPNIAILSPLNRTFTTPEVPLIFTVNEPASWKGYSLDGQPTVFAANITLPALPIGSHTLKVYANDTAGNTGASETITFSIVEPESETFPTLPVAVASGASIAAVAVGLLVYFKKRKR
jgi:hypothetical protein